MFSESKERERGDRCDRWEGCDRARERGDRCDRWEGCDRERERDKKPSSAKSDQPAAFI